MTNRKNTLKVNGTSSIVRNSTATIAILDPTASEPTIESSETTQETALAKFIGPIQQKEVKAAPQEGCSNFTCTCPLTGIVFVTSQAAEREYCSAVVVDSPVGRVVARWSRDHKANLRIAKAILAGTGTAGFSNPVVVDVKTVDTLAEGSTMTTRRNEVAYYATMGLLGPNHAKREADKAARDARKAPPLLPVAPPMSEVIEAGRMA